MIYLGEGGGIEPQTRIEAQGLTLYCNQIVTGFSLSNRPGESQAQPRSRASGSRARLLTRPVERLVRLRFATV